MLTLLRKFFLYFYRKKNFECNLIFSGKSVSRVLYANLIMRICLLIYLVSQSSKTNRELDLGPSSIKTC